MNDINHKINSNNHNINLKCNNNKFYHLKNLIKVIKCKINLKKIYRSHLN